VHAERRAIGEHGQQHRRQRAAKVVSSLDNDHEIAAPWCARSAGDESPRQLGAQCVGEVVGSRRLGIQVDGGHHVGQRGAGRQHTAGGTPTDQHECQPVGTAGRRQYEDDRRQQACRGVVIVSHDGDVRAVTTERRHGDGAPPADPQYGTGCIRLALPATGDGDGVVGRSCEVRCAGLSQPERGNELGLERLRAAPPCRRGESEGARRGEGDLDPARIDGDGRTGPAGEPPRLAGRADHQSPRTDLGVDVRSDLEHGLVAMPPDGHDGGPVAPVGAMVRQGMHPLPRRVVRVQRQAPRLRAGGRSELEHDGAGDC